MNAIINNQNLHYSFNGQQLIHNKHFHITIILLSVIYNLTALSALETTVKYCLKQIKKVIYFTLDCSAPR